MADSDRLKAEKIALAKKKLKEFEMKRQRESPVLSSEHNGRQSTISSESGYQVNGSGIDLPVSEQPHSHAHSAHSTSSNQSATDKGHNTENAEQHHEHSAPPILYDVHHQQVSEQTYQNYESSHPDLSFQSQLQQEQLQYNHNHAAHPYADSNGENHQHQQQKTFQENVAQPVHEFAPVAAPFPSQSEDVSKLKMERDEIAAAYEQVKGQMEQLLSHYTQLHTAYSQISSHGVHSDVEKQILQLQSAVAVLVEEKTALQSELRSTKENLEKAIREKVSHEKETIVTGEVSVLRSRIEEFERIQTARMHELDTQRREAAHMQAQLRTLNNEKSDAQARLKAVFREKESVDTQLSALRKELQMKDIYLKQLGTHGNLSNAVPVNQDQLQQMHSRLESLSHEVTELRTARDAAAEETQSVRQHYEAVNRELAEKYKATQEELDSVQTMRWAGEAKIRELEDQIQVLNDSLATKENQLGKSTGEIGNVVSTESAPIPSITALSGITQEEVNHKVREAVKKTVREWEQTLEEEMRKADQAIQEKDRVLFEKEQALAETQMRYRLLEERTLETQANGADLLSLSEQLQNEKATVSRALAQNRELKEQLIEIQNRIVTLTEEKLASELARQTAEHQVKTLMQRMDLQDAGLIGPNEPMPAMESHREETENNEQSNSGNARETRGESVSSNKSSSAGGDSRETPESTGFEDIVEFGKQQIAQLQRQLEESERIVSQLRTEFRRSEARNEELQQIMRQNSEDENQNSILVELTQAVQRINTLVSDNQQLRENLDRAVTALHEMEVKQSHSAENIENQQQLVTTTSSPFATALDATTPIHTAYSETESSSATNRTPSQVTVLSADDVSHGAKSDISLASSSQTPTNSLHAKKLHLGQNTDESTPSPSQSTDSEAYTQAIIKDDIAPLTHQPIASVEPLQASPAIVVRSGNHLQSQSQSQQVVGTKEWAFQSLETRFNEVMSKYAQQQEHVDQLEHINTQLQLENDTIADHVVLYQHQRRLIRERMRAKDLQLAEMEREREKTVRRCKELQDALMLVLGQNGILKEYQIGPPTRGKKHSTAKRRNSRSYSQSTVDELSGDEHLIVDAKNEIVPPREEFEQSHAASASPPSANNENGAGNASSVISELSTSLPQVHEGQSRPRADSASSGRSEEELEQSTDRQKSPGNTRTISPSSVSPPLLVRPHSPAAQTAAVKKILQILNDISNAPLQPSAANNLHCTQCIGNLETI